MARIYLMALQGDGLRGFSRRSLDEEMRMATLNVNGKSRAHDAKPDSPLLRVLRELLGLSGRKYGCGVAQCGSRRVHNDGAPVRSCVMPCSAVQPSQKVVTIEGLSSKGDHAVNLHQIAAQVEGSFVCGLPAALPI
ncbi:MAG: (2Fe-2S)-binding protein [Inhella sp.]